jgi:hypothetical protein
MSKEIKAIRDYMQKISKLIETAEETDEEVVQALIDSHAYQRDKLMRLTKFRQAINDYRGTITKKWLQENMP